MKQLCIALISIHFLFYSFSGLVKKVTFHMFQESITQSYCINKTNTSMHCEGKCYLKKMMDDEKNKLEDSWSSFHKLDYTSPSFYMLESCRTSAFPVTYIIPFAKEFLPLPLLVVQTPPPDYCV